MSFRLHVALLALVFASLTACSSTKNQKKAVETDNDAPTEYTNPIARQRLEARIENIKFQRGVELITNLERIIANGEAAIPALERGLKASSAMTRMGCCYCLGRIGDNRAVAMLKPVLKDEVGYVRYEAAAALGTLGSREGYPVLVQGLADERLENRFKCHEALQLFTRQNFGYSHNAAPEVRKVAMQKWQEWLSRLESEEL